MARSASLAGNLDPHHRVAIADLDPRARRASARPSSGWCATLEPDVVGLSIMTFQRGTARRIAALVRATRAGGHDRRRRLRSEPGAEVYEDPAWGVDVIVRGEGDITFRELLRALEARDAAVGMLPDCRSARAATFRRTPPRRSARSTGEDVAPAEPRGPRAQRATPCIGRPDRRRRDLARLHLRLQLLLDHRDARPELPHLVDRSRARRHRRRARARRARDLHRRRQHHAERRAIRGALPGDRRRGLERHRLHRPGDDVVDRRARRDAGAADAARPDSATCFSASRTSWTRIWRSCGRAAKNARARERPAGRQCHASARSSVLHRHGMYVVGGLIVGNPKRHARVDRSQPRRSRASTSTGPTSSIRRRIRARR